MTSKIFRKNLVTGISAAVQRAKDLAEVNHHGLRGRCRELVAKDMLSPMLPSGYSYGNGKIVDRYDNQSGETDLIIYDSEILPPVLYGDSDGVFPIESVFYALEIKSKVTSVEIKDAIKKGRKFKDLKSEASSMTWPYDGSMHPRNFAYVFFAFDSDLTGDKKSELDRYAELDPDWNKNPVVRAICVVGKGYWYFAHDPDRWIFHPETDEFDEVIDFVAGMSNTLSNSRWSSRKSKLGGYLMTSRDVYDILVTPSTESKEDNAS